MSDARDASALFDKFAIATNRRSTGDVELTLRSWVRVARAWASELRRRDRWRDRLRAWPLGFKVKSYQLFDLASRDASLFVPDFPLVRRATFMNGFWNPIIGNKLVLAYVASAVGVPTPAVLGCIIQGRAHDLAGVPHTDLLAALEAWSTRAPRLVFRPHWSGAGEGVFFVDCVHGQWRINERPADTHELTRLVGSLHRYLITEWVQQADYAQRIYPRTPNTVRVLTLRDANGPFVAAAVHRFGTSRSFPVDNFHAGHGGLSATMDITTGTLGVALGGTAHGRVVPQSVHPETHEPIEGVMVPHYRAAVDGMLRLCHALPEGVWVGWDVLMTNDGYRIIEGNSLPALQVWQVHRPLLADARVARFFAAHGVGRARERA